MAALLGQSTLGAACGVEGADENELYGAMDWLTARQARVERALAGRHLASGSLVLYDLTSVYVEGSHCPLALADRSFSGAVGIMLGASAVLGGMIFLDTLYPQVVTGHSAIETGLLFVPMALALIVGSQWGVLFIGHHGPRGSTLAGFLAMGLGMLYLSRLPTSGDVLVDVVPGLASRPSGPGPRSCPPPPPRSAAWPRRGPAGPLAS